MFRLVETIYVARDRSTDRDSSNAGCSAAEVDPDMNIMKDGVIFPKWHWALRWNRVPHAYGLGIWIPDRAIFPDRVIIGFGVILTLEWMRKSTTPA